MNKRIAIGVVVSVVLLGVLCYVIFASDWSWFNDTPSPVPYDPEPGHVDPGSLNYVLFEQYGPLLIVLAILMFGAMVGGIVVAREEIERDKKKNDDSKEGKE